jgi:hypothetical protein
MLPPPDLESRSVALALAPNVSMKSCVSPWLAMSWPPDSRSAGRSLLTSAGSGKPELLMVSALVPAGRAGEAMKSGCATLLVVSPRMPLAL